MMDLRQAAQLLGGDVSAGRILAPGPGHSRNDRSLSIRFASDAPDGFVVTSFANDDWQSCKDHVRKALGGGERLPFQQVAPISSEPDVDEQRNRERALAIWDDAVPLSGTPAETYLAGRRVPYGGEALRWHPNCPFGRGARVGCMVALVRNIVTDEPQAIHRTAIDRDGKKLSHLGSNGRMTLAPIRGGAIKLSDTVDVVADLGIGEGIETTLSLPIVTGRPHLPVWSLISASVLSAFPALPGLRTIWFAMDHDPAGMAAASTVIATLASNNINTIIVAPDSAGDLNDMVNSHA